MNKESTLRILRQRLSNITEPSADFLRAERLHNGNALAVYYFDFTGVIAGPTFDLDRYSQERIASDFYKNKGSVQWNYYLYFVLREPDFARLRATPRIAEIERERTFARKFVREQQELNAELADPLVAFISGPKASPDVASRWVEALHKANLDPIANSKADYASTVRDYLAGSALNRSRDDATKETVEDGTFIKKLRFTQYRPQPKQRVFEFGTVNLFRGVNGTGKTSILEAIELSICGGNRRQDGRIDGNTILEVHFAGKPREERCPASSIAKYRGRDLAWYGGYYRNGNNLHRNFGRFNFFDTDAAFQFSSSKNGAGIVDALNSLLLGEFATTIEERMNQFLERFSREEKEVHRSIHVRRHELTSVSQQMEKLRAIKDTREALLEELSNKAEGCGWRRLPPRMTINALAVLQETIDDAATRIKSHAYELRWLGRISVASLQREKLQSTQALAAVSQQQALIKSTDAEIERFAGRMLDIKEQIELLRRLHAYHAEAEFLWLQGKGALVEAQKAKITQLKEAERLLRGVDFSLFTNVTTPLAAFKFQCNREVEDARGALESLKARASALRRQVGALNVVIEEIKGLGRRFCEITPDAKDCPLCGAKYEKLADHLRSDVIEAGITETLEAMVPQIGRATADLEALQKTANQVLQLERAAYILLLSTQVATQAVKSTATTVKDIVDGAEQESTKLDEVIAKVKRLELAGFRERELIELCDKAHSEYSIPREQLTKRDAVDKLLTKAIASMAQLQRNEREATKKQKELTAELKRSVKRFVDTEELDEAIVELERRAALTVDVLEDIESLQRNVTLRESDELLTVATKLKTFGASVERIQRALVAVEEKDTLEEGLLKNLATAKAALAGLESRHARAKEAMSVLNKLLGSEYKGEYSKKVLADHKNRISTIFSRIHAPHEFKDVELAEAVKLLRHSGKTSTVSEISTGQRAALALSVFLALNSSVAQKAPWLLFDDPVVHVDDLNILSFMDMLRDLALLGGRQIFFATASSRIGDLFAKKFDCLGSSFCEFRLER